MKKTDRKLVLHRETLAPLQGEVLDRVHGGVVSAPPTVTRLSCVADRCQSNGPSLPTTAATTTTL